jgi:hypothetical protein
MKQNYSSEIAQEILDKFHQKGWNLYKSDNINQIGPDENIRKNLVEFLEINERYILLPVADNPRNPKQVMDALEILAQKLNREMPTIRVGYESHPLTGITLKKDSVKITTPEGIYVSYPIFIESLDSIVQTR